MLYKPSLLKPVLRFKGLFKGFLWYLLSFGKLWIFYILDGAKVAHYSYVIQKNIRFPFMSDEDLQIGPCYTDVNYRGQGLYQTALKCIPISFSNKSNTFWIFTTVKNSISQHVILKAGFSLVGIGYTRGMLKRLILSRLV